MGTDNCPECGGNGYHWRDSSDSYGEHETEEWPCESCDGLGTVEVDEPLPPDLKTTEPLPRISMSDLVNGGKA